MNGHVRMTAAAVSALLAVGNALPVASHAAGLTKRVTGVTASVGTTRMGTTSGLPSPPPQSGAGMPGQGGPGGGSGGSGGGGLLISGTITGVNTTADTITVTPTNSATPETIGITSSTKLVGNETISASAIAVGNRLLITGIPTSVLATGIVDDQAARSTSTSSSNSSSSASSSATNTPPMMPVPAVVTALSPLMVEVNGEYSVTITTNSSTTVTEALPITLSELAAGDAVSVQATESSSGTLTATYVDATAAS